MLFETSGGRLVNHGDVLEETTGRVSQVVINGAATHVPQVGTVFTSILVFEDIKLSAIVAATGYTIHNIADIYGEIIPAGTVYPLRANSITVTEGIGIAYEGD